MLEDFKRNLEYLAPLSQNVSPSVNLELSQFEMKQIDSEEMSDSQIEEEDMDED